MKTSLAVLALCVLSATSHAAQITFTTSHRAGDSIQLMVDGKNIEIEGIDTKNFTPGEQSPSVM